MPESNSSDLDNVIGLAEEDTEDLSFDYEAFLRRMKHPSCRPLLAQIKSLINRFRITYETTSVPTLVHIYRTSLDSLMEDLRENPVWRLVGDRRPGEFDIAREGLEYLIMNQIHPFAFAPTADDRDKDELIYRKMLLHSLWLQPSHLDVRTTDEESMTEAIKQFQKVNEYLTPRDKLICLLHGCKIVQKSVGEEASADEIMPLLIFTIIKAQIGQYHSNLQYISRYRDQRALADDKAYHFTSLLAAATFIERLDQSSLVISEGEYQGNMEEAVMRLNEQMVNIQEDEFIATQLDHDHSSTRSLLRQNEIITSEDKFKEDATRLFLHVKDKVKLGASKSIEYLGDLMDKAEAKLKATVISRSTSPSSITSTQRNQALAEEDEFQLQLAMALSLSEQEHTRQKTEDPHGDGPLVDVQEEIDSKSSSIEPP